jgi:hypothetical protein
MKFHSNAKSKWKLQIILREKREKKSPKTQSFYLGFVTFVLSDLCSSYPIAISKFA